jgi:hypothetical protein
MKTYIDTETCGLHGLAVLIQYAFDNDEPTLYNPWLNPAKETRELIERFMETTIVGFNLAFDHFHLCKWYTLAGMLNDHAIPAELPLIEVAQAEMDGRDGPCLKPVSALDLWLHSRKGPYQFLMDRKEVRVRKVPSVIADRVKDYLAETITFPDILDARWGVYDRKRLDVVDPEFKDVCLRFRPSGGLKALAKHCLGREVIEYPPPPREDKLFELGFVPFALGVSDPSDWKGRNNRGEFKGYTWPHHIKSDIDYWENDDTSRKYAYDDVILTRDLEEHFEFPEPGDDDSILACMVAAVRWHGFEIDGEAIEEQRKKAQKVVDSSPVNVNKVTEVRKYIMDAMDPTEAILMDENPHSKKMAASTRLIEDSTKKANLEKIRDRLITDEEEMCFNCFGEGCNRCGGKGVVGPGRLPASIRCDEILTVKAAAKEVELFNKLLRAGRLHASFKVIGTKSTRMSGGDGLNTQGIKKSRPVREAFPLKWNGMILCGGDFDSFEITIADAVFGDPTMRRDLLKGVSVHTVMAENIYPDKTREEILASKALADGSLIDMYSRGKQGVFAMLYGGDEGTLQRKLSIAAKVAEAAMNGFQARYPRVREVRESNARKFACMVQEGGIGTEIKWIEPDDYCETFLGFKRYFTLENQICEALYEIAQHPPKFWMVEGKIKRNRDDDQTIVGATCSALYGAARQLAAADVRAANNHLIQSPGAQITKGVQRAIWDLQPVGANDWVVAPMNIHDEIMCVTRPDKAVAVAEIVGNKVEEYREVVPLIGLEWVTDQKTWGEKVDDDRRTCFMPDRQEMLSDLDDPDIELMTFEMELEDYEEADL